MAALHAHFSHRVKITGNSTGLHFTAEFQDHEFTDDLVDALKKAGVLVYPVEAHAIVKNRHSHKIILGYGNLTPEEINEGVARMKGVLR